MKKDKKMNSVKDKKKKKFSLFSMLTAISLLPLVLSIVIVGMNQEVSANVTEIISEVQMVNEHCEKMNDMAGKLEESVAYFHN